MDGFDWIGASSDPYAGSGDYGYTYDSPSSWGGGTSSWFPVPGSNGSGSSWTANTLDKLLNFGMQMKLNDQQADYNMQRMQLQQRAQNGQIYLEGQRLAKANTLSPTVLLLMAGVAVFAVMKS